MKYGRDDDTWEQLTGAGLGFLIERARLRRPTSYTELNAALVHRTGLRGFDFEEASERAAMGYLLGLIVDRNHASTGLMISALVHYLNENDAGPGFYDLATRLGLLRPRSPQPERLDFWIEQVNAVFDLYAARP